MSQDGTLGEQVGVGVMGVSRRARQTIAHQKFRASKISLGGVNHEIVGVNEATLRKKPFAEPEG